MKTHLIGAGNLKGWQTTACGIVAMKGVMNGEYDTIDGGRIEAKYNDWRGMTCGRCLRNPHASGGRLTATPKAAKEG